jgi:hypothetical protein
VRDEVLIEESASTQAVCDVCSRLRARSLYGGRYRAYTIVSQAGLAGEEGTNGKLQQESEQGLSEASPEDNDNGGAAITGGFPQPWREGPKELVDASRSAKIPQT